MATTNDYINSIFTSILFRLPTDDELTYYASEINNDFITPTSLTLLGSELTEFSENLLLAQTYYCAFARYMEPSEMLLWGDVAYSGATTKQIANQFLNSYSFSSRFNSADTVEDIIGTIYLEATGSTISDNKLDDYVTGLTNANYSGADILVDIAKQTNALDIGLALVYKSLYNDSSKDFNSSSYDLDVRTAVSEIFNEYETQATELEETNGLNESSGKLTISSTFQSDVSINLTTKKINTEDSEITLESGNLLNVTTIDASDFSEGELTLIGSAIDETIYLGTKENNIRAVGGDDTLYLNSSTDTIIFEETALYNGIDSINDFTKGTSGDILNFSNFLNVTNATNVASCVSSSSTAEISWTNGSVIVANGYSLDTPEEIAELFGAGKAFAAPSVASKSVLITADIVGDASIWYITNQTSVASIEASEVLQVGTLVGINNLTLSGFDSTNFL